MKRLLSLLLVMAMAVSLAACGAGNHKNTNESTTDQTQNVDGDDTGNSGDKTDEPQTEVIKDSQGNEFEVPMEINSAIVLNSSIYEMICVLGKDDVVIGVGDTITSPASALEKDKYGDWREPNVELILEAEPDIVFGYASWLDSGIAQQFTDAGIPVCMLDLYVPSTIMNEVSFLGKLLDAEERAEAFNNDVREILDLVAQRTADLEPISVYWEGYTDYKSVGKGSGGDELMQLAKVKSLTGEEDTAYPEISDEWLLENNPDMVVKMISSTKGIMGETINDPTAVQEVYNGIVSRPGWSGVNAVKDGKVLILYSRIGTSPLGLAMAPLYIAKTAYPDQFQDVDPDTYLSDMLSTYWGEELTGIWTFAGA